MAGVAATQQHVFVADRDPLDTQDIFRCLRADDGVELWSVRNLSRGELDYGNAQRATPLVHGSLVYFYNAFGQFFALRVADGSIAWKKDLIRHFGGGDPQNAWGTTSSPLVVDGKLIVNPGGPEASIVALSPDSGELIWKTPGERAAFSSLIVGEFGGRKQLVGYDQQALCGWDIERGTRLWRLVPPRKNDFNVPTPIAFGGKLLVATENNGTRLYRFNADGTIDPKPEAVNDELAPDTHTPVVCGTRLIGIWEGLYCLDLSAGLRTIWKATDKAFDDYGTAIASGERVLVVSKHGELFLIDPMGEEYRLIARAKAFEDDPGVYSHPALVGRRLYLRGSEEIVCLDLGADGE